MSTSNAASSKPVVHHEPTRADRKQTRELAEARQSGQVAPAIDSATGQMINPHNPEFITKRPWYLGDGNDGGAAVAAAAGESLQHQTAQKPDQDKTVELSLTKAEELLQKRRQQQKQLRQKGQFVKGQWVEALKRNKLPYQMCQITKVHRGSMVDLKYEDGSIETRVKTAGNNNNKRRPRVRMTNTGNRSNLEAADNTNDNDNDVVQFKETYDSKRDQYHGYDRDKHNATIVQKHEQRLEIRRRLREDDKQHAEKEKESTKEEEDGGNGNSKPKANSNSDSDNVDSDSDVDSDAGSGNESTDDEFVQRDEDAKVIATRLARQGGVGGAQMKVTARNLRIREDTAKYLRNLDANSAYYDPKSRSMRDNPNANDMTTNEETDFAGDNFARISGDAVELAKQQMFAWEASERGVAEIHPQANPSQAELLKKQFQTQSHDLKKQRQQQVLTKYGGQEYLDGTDGLAIAASASAGVGPDGDEKKRAAAVASKTTTTTQEEEERKLRFGVSTQAQEYSRDGRKVAKGDDTKKRTILQSKYEEDNYMNGHNTVWGSYFHKGAFTWGYNDDHSLMKMSYCTGPKGKVANDEANEQMYGTGLAGTAALAQARNLLPKSTSQQQKDGGHAQSSIVDRSKLYGEADPNAQLDSTKVQEALMKQQQQQQQQQEDDDDANNNKKKKRKKYHSIHADVEMTEEMMEAYRLTKDQKSNDPMAKIGNIDELLDYKK